MTSMDQLLKWGLANSTENEDAPSIRATTEDIASGRRPDLSDPKLLEAIMGKSDAQMMTEELMVAVNDRRSEDDRVTALDNFEMLIEQIDNANNMQNLGMWPPLLSLLSSDSPRIALAAAWILGTAVQNNDKAQVAVLQHTPLPPLLALLESTDMELRSKAMYALSGILKHNPRAVQIFEELDGWSKLKAALLDPNITLRRKTAFLINTLLMQDSSVQGTPADATADTRPVPVGLLGAPPQDDGGSTSQTPPRISTATALAPGPDERPGPHAAHSGPGAPPLERGPETMLSGAAHPDVACALLRSRCFSTLVASLLPAGALDMADATNIDVPPAAGPDGDSEPRTDLDYAEKAARAVITFGCKIPADPESARAMGLDAQPLKLLQRFAQELGGEPLDEEMKKEGKRRWEELEIERTDWEEFLGLVKSLAGTS